MSPDQILLLGVVAGGTIFLGLPIGRVRSASGRLKAFLGSASVGILLFLFWDVVTGAVGPIEEALDNAVSGGSGWSGFVVLATLGAGGLAVALLGLVAYDGWMARRRMGIGPGAAARAEFAPRGLSTAAELSLLIAVGIGLHNFAEGLAIGQSAAAGQLSLALTLVVGFGLHNATEGFGIVAPLAGQAERPTWSWLLLLGLIGGGPTALGTIVGQAFVSTEVSVAFLGLAAGSILYVISELLNVNRAFGLKMVATVGIVVGLFLGFGTDFALAAMGG